MPGRGLKRRITILIRHELWGTRGRFQHFQNLVQHCQSTLAEHLLRHLMASHKPLVPKPFYPDAHMTRETPDTDAA